MAKKKSKSRKPADQRHDQRVLLNLTKAELKAFDAAAAFAGVSRSSWIRQRCRDAARSELEAADQPVPFLKTK